MRALVALALVALLAACDAEVPLGGDVYQAEGTDYPSAASLLPDGALALGVLTEGTIAPTDGTIGYPGVVRFDAGGELVGAEVYRTVERTYSGVEGVAPHGDGLAVAVREEHRVVVYRTDARGRNRRVLFKPEEEAWLPSDALTAVPGGFVLRVYPRTTADPHLYALDADGDLRWTYRLPDAQDVRALAAAPDGDLFAVGPRSEGGITVARLSLDGAERWRRDIEETDLRVAAAVGDGLALVFQQLVGTYEGKGPDRREVEVRIVRLEGDGGAAWEQAAASVSVEDGGVQATALAGLPDGWLALGLAAGSRNLDGGTRATIRVLSADGTERQSVVVGRPDEATTFVTHLLPAPDGRLFVVSAVGPERLGSYGGDDFDIVVSSLGLDG